MSILYTGQSLNCSRLTCKNSQANMHLYDINLGFETGSFASLDGEMCTWKIIIVTENHSHTNQAVNELYYPEIDTPTKNMIF